jgi:hypothetical protein
MTSKAAFGAREFKPVLYAFCSRVNDSFSPPPRTDFGKAPPGYVPGVGRGAGALIEGVKVLSEKRGAYAPPAASDSQGNEEAAPANPDESTYNEWDGYGGSLFSNTPFAFNILF